MAKKIRDIIFVLICVSALLVSSVSACACADHGEGTEAASCHKHSPASNATHPEKDSQDHYSGVPEKHSHEHQAAGPEKHSHEDRGAVREKHSHKHQAAHSEDPPLTHHGADPGKDSYEKQSVSSFTSEIVETGFIYGSDSNCVCYQAAPKVVSNSKQLKPVKYISVGSSLVTIEPVYKTASLHINNFIISRFVPTDSLYNLPPGRAPPRL